MNNKEQHLREPQQAVLRLTNVIRWPDADRLRMIDKSEFYSEPRVYQYGYYDGYQIQNEKIDRAVKLIQEARQNSESSDAILQDAIILLLGQACV